VKELVGRLNIGVLFFSICGTLFLSNLTAQGVHPEVQAQIDSLQAWIQTEINEKGSVDQEELAAWNNRIRETQERIAREGSAAKPSAGLDSRVELKTFTGFVGTSFTVPEGKAWKVRKITVSGGLGEYQILVTSVSYDKLLQSGDILSTPAFSSEAALISDDQSNAMYTYEIMEFDIR
jgi:hypothetical protein